MLVARLHRAYTRDHTRQPSRVIVATETFPVRAVEMFQYAESRPYVIGNFIWTAIDCVRRPSKRRGTTTHTPQCLALCLD